MDLGYDFGQTLQANSIVCLFGELGAGKTTFVKGLAEGAAGIDAQKICSPTFVYMNIYKGHHRVVYHFDLYRLRSADEFLSMGFDEMFGEGICCIEWSEKIATLLPGNCIKVTLNHAGKNVRVIRIDP